MNSWRRLKNLWRLSEYESGKPSDEYKQPGTQIVTLVKKPETTQKAVFIPRRKLSPIEEINSSNETQ